MMTKRIVFLGDSDISRWPPSLYPSSDNDIRCVNIAKGGAVISDMQKQLETFRDSDEYDKEANTLFVACAGENDISMGMPIDAIQKAFTSLIGELFESQQFNISSLIFFGPKFEPWLSDDFASRKMYVKLSNALQRTLRETKETSYSSKIFLVDCLTMFCTAKSKDVPGAYTVEEPRQIEHILIPMGCI